MHNMQIPYAAANHIWIYLYYKIYNLDSQFLLYNVILRKFKPLLLC